MLVKSSNIGLLVQYFSHGLQKSINLDIFVLLVFLDGDLMGSANLV